MPLKVLTCIEGFGEYNQLLFGSQLAVKLYSKQKGAEKLLYRYSRVDLKKFRR